MWLLSCARSVPAVISAKTENSGGASRITAQQGPSSVSISADANAYLYLRRGDATSGTALHENDDHGGSTSVSQIQETLAAGTYTIEATTYSAGETGTFSPNLALMGTPTTPGTVAGDRAALVAFYNATGGPNWANNTGWLTDAPLGQ